ncbi:hypothetical protein [Microcella sp.]|uniref:hypothetical protein n=1 Tax=Microcella sp. TaxID=1913979 RepID=UPI00256A281F|nr:hypothetical protein [Microcella sp.]MBX9472446.1 hypothetical protein [Microcella sp.]
MRFLPPSPAADAADAQFSREILEQHVSEGVLVARSALRLAVKNGVIMSTLRDARPWSTDEVTTLAREAVDSLIAELSATAERLDAEAAAHPVRGRGRRRHDAERELSRLELRARTARGVVQRLRRMRTDDSAIARLVETARDDTLTELTKARLFAEHEFANQSADERRIAMEGVAADLLDLRERLDAMRELGDSGW